MTRPSILITLDTGEATRRGVAFPNVHTKQAYVEAVEAAGGLPLLVAPTHRADTIEAMLERMNGLVVTGGAFDIHPDLYGAQSVHRLDETKPTRTRFEWTLLEHALAAGCPVLGVCGGMQLLNVVLGGTLIQDIRSEVGGALEHEQASSPTEPDHPVALEPTGRLAALLGQTLIEVNTTHHQAIGRLGRDLEVEGRSPDGVVEAIAHTGKPAVIGVQWHPELLQDEVSAALYGQLVAQARARA